MNLKVLVLNDLILITQIDEVPTELGEPDCKLTEPFVLNEDGTLSPWLIDVSNQNVFMIHSDKILTITEPNTKLSEKYKDLVKE
jgi:hypothetical protein|tara:strand:+ start:450 stop:701 length:252 start_codon:yes stop_codon:yes gene_type:complete